MVWSASVDVLTLCVIFTLSGNVIQVHLRSSFPNFSTFSLNVTVFFCTTFSGAVFFVGHGVAYSIMSLVSIIQIRLLH